MSNDQLQTVPTRNSVIDTVREVLAGFADRFGYSQHQVAQGSVVRYKVRTLGRDFTASEITALGVVVDRLVELGLTRPALIKKRRTYCMDFDLASNPTLHRTQEDEARVKRMTHLIDHVLMLLEVEPIQPLPALMEKLTRAFDSVEARRAVQFLRARGLANTFDIHTTRLVGEANIEAVTTYIMSGQARMQVSGSAMKYPIMTLLNTAIAAGPPSPQSKRGPKPQHKRNAMILERHRASSQGSVGARPVVTASHPDYSKSVKN